MIPIEIAARSVIIPFIRWRAFILKCAKRLDGPPKPKNEAKAVKVSVTAH
jgi:hypothetical protein